jgi:hypothetical protein
MDILSSTLEKLAKLKDLSLGNGVTVTGTLGKLAESIAFLRADCKMDILSSTLEKLAKLKDLSLGNGVTVTGTLGKLAESLAILKADCKMSILSSALSGLEKLQHLHLHSDVTMVDELKELTKSLYSLELYAKGRVNLLALASAGNVGLGGEMDIIYAENAPRINVVRLSLHGDKYESVPLWLIKVERCQAIDIADTRIKKWPFGDNFRLPKGISEIRVNADCKELYNDNTRLRLRNLTHASEVECVDSNYYSGKRLYLRYKT